MELSPSLIIANKIPRNKTPLDTFGAMIFLLKISMGILPYSFQ